MKLFIISWASHTDEGLPLAPQRPQIFRKLEEAKAGMDSIVRQMQTFWQFPLIVEVVNIENIGKFVNIWEALTVESPGEVPGLPQAQRRPTPAERGRLMGQLRQDEIDWQLVPGLILPTDVRK